MIRPRLLLASAISSLLALFACRGEKTLVSSERADKILVIKSAHMLSLMSGDRALRTYKVALGRSPVSAKTRKGDHKTPEGIYLVDAKKEHSRFYRALHISYPNRRDQQEALKGGWDPGGDVEIHGIQNGIGWIGSLHRRIDWTDGCIAVTDSEMDEIWSAVKVGTPVEIRP